MSPAALFAMGVLVTLFYGTGLSLLVYGAILDGRADTLPAGPVLRPPAVPSIAGGGRSF